MFVTSDPSLFNRSNNITSKNHEAPYCVIFSGFLLHENEYFNFTCCLITRSRKGVALEVNLEEIKYMFMSCHQNVGQNFNTNITDKTFESLAKFTHIRMTLLTHSLHGAGHYLKS
jgi:hypothetical protein